MKKNFFMLAATAALFAACAETELVNEVNVEGTQQEIGFSTFAGKTTRAENSTQTEKQGLRLQGHRALCLQVRQMRICQEREQI